MILTVVFLAGCVCQSRAASLLERSVGIRMGLSGPNKGASFQETEVFAFLELPWQWQWDSGWSVATQVDLALGVLSGAGKTAVLSSFAPGVKVGRVGSGFALLAHTGIVLVSEHDFEQQSIGGPFQFGLYAGAMYRFRNGIQVSYWYRHLSNASIFHPNPGLEMHLVGLSYTWPMRRKR